MNMISTGAFLTEMDASNKQPTVAEKFAAVWEKKNAKAARAGGVSLMALSLAACGGSSSTTTTTTTDTTTTTPVTPAAQSIALTALADTVVGGDGDDTIDATEILISTTVTNTLTAMDTVDGGAGSDTMNINETAANFTLPAGITVKNVETVNVTGMVLGSSGGANVSFAGFTGLETLNATAIATDGTAGDVALLTAAATTDVNLTVANQYDDDIVVDGGKDITITAGGVDDTHATIDVGGTTAAKGAVTITQDVLFGDADDVAPAINVTGGTTINVTQTVGATSSYAFGTDTSAEDYTQGAVGITGGAETTDVTVTQSTANTKVNYAAYSAATATATGTLAVPGEFGVINGAVTIADKNASSATDAGTIATVTLNGYGNSTIDSGALETVNISGKGGTLGITAGALTTANVSALTINASKATAGAITADADYKTVTVDGSTGASTIANLTASGATTLNVSGGEKVTFTAQTLAAVTDINVTNTAGVSLGSQLGNSVTFDAVGGDDAIKIGATHKAIDMGAGDDTVTVVTSALGTSTTLGNGSVAGGEGKDTLVMDVTEAATASATTTFGNTITGFEAIKLTQDVSNTGSAITVALDNIDSSMNEVTIDGAQDMTITGLAPGAKATITSNAAASGTDTVLTVGSASGTSDEASITLANSSGSAADFGTLNVANIETINITASDTGKVSAGNQYATVDTIDLTASTATKIVVSGNNGLNMGTISAAKVTEVDASGIAGDNSTEDIAANLAFTYTSGNTTAGATITGGAGNDALQGNKKADVIKGGAGNDTITGTAGADTIDGGAGTGDTYATGGAQVASAVEGAGTGESIGMVINLGADAVTNATVFAKTGEYLATSLASAAGGTAAYIYTDESSVYSTVVDTITNIEHVDISGEAGIHFVVGNDAKNTITTGAAANITDADHFDGGAGTDTLLILADNNGTGAVLEDLVGIEKITTDANSTAAHDIKITIKYTSANTDAITIDASDQTDTGSTLTLVASDAEVDGALTVTGAAGADTITTNDGADVIDAGTGADVVSVGAADTVIDKVIINAGDANATVSLGTSGSANSSLSAFDKLYEFEVGTASYQGDILDLAGTATVAADSAATGIDIATTTNVVAYHGTTGGSSTTFASLVISDGMVTFHDNDTVNSGTTDITVSKATIAGAVKALQGIDLGDAGATVAFIVADDSMNSSADSDSTKDTYVYQQTTAAAGGATGGGYILIGLDNVEADKLTTTHDIGANDLFIM